MHPLQNMAGLMIWAARNTAFNLDFIPDDKLDWKPSPTAPSALEIVQHVCVAIRSMSTVIRGEEFVMVLAELPTSRAQAQQMLTEGGEAFAGLILQLNPERLGDSVTIYRGMQVPLARASIMPIVDMLHHHGQVAYLQMILGDAESHFHPEAM